MPDARTAALAAAARLVRARPARLGRTRLVAVDGPSGSGKTSLAEPLAEAIADEFGGRVYSPGRTPDRTHPGPTVAVVSTDLLATWDDPLGWWPRWEQHLLAPLAAGRVARLPVLHWVSGVPHPGGEIVLPPVDVLVTEGVSSGRAAAAARISVLIWVGFADAAARLERAVARDGEGERAHLVAWQHMEERHFAEDATRARADVVIPGGAW